MIKYLGQVIDDLGPFFLVNPLMVSGCKLLGENRSRPSLLIKLEFSGFLVFLLFCGCFLRFPDLDPLQTQLNPDPKQR